VSFFGDAPAELLYSMPGIGGAVTNTLTVGQSIGGPLLGGGGTGGAGSLVPPAVLPYNYFSKQGKAILIEGFGVYSLGATIPTLKLGIALDTAIGTQTTVIGTTGAFTVDTTSRSNMCFNFKLLCTATQVGVNGQLQSSGFLNWGMQGGTTITTTVVLPAISYQLGTGTTTPVPFNTVTSTPVYIEPYAWWSTSSTGPSITLTQMLVWGLN
jgi:hypothetical protein